jgi:hypothetical protein
MKKISILILVALVYGQSYGQSHGGNHNTAGDDNSKWNVFGNLGDGADWLGTTNSFPLIFKTNNTQRMSLDANGVFNLVNLAGTGSRMLQTDANGNLIFLPTGSSGQFLQSDGTWANLPSSATAWKVNGNNIFNTNSGFTGIGTSNPLYPLDVVGSAHVSSNLIVDGGLVLTDINKTPNGIQLNIGGNAVFTGGLQATSLAGTGGIVYADPSGNLRIGPSSSNINSSPCITNASPWFEGGNNNSANQTIGTCDNLDFILKANNNPRIWVKNTGEIGFGTAAPVDKYHFYGGNVAIGNGPFGVPFNGVKMLTVDGDVCLANYGSGGFSGLEIMGMDKVPSKRGISTEQNPNGDLNFFINGTQSSGTPEFKFKNGLLPGTFTQASASSLAPDLMVLNSVGATRIIGYMPPSYTNPLLTLESYNSSGNTIVTDFKADGSLHMGPHLQIGFGNPAIQDNTFALNINAPTNNGIKINTTSSSKVISVINSSPPNSPFTVTGDGVLNITTKYTNTKMFAIDNTVYGASAFEINSDGRTIIKVDPSLSADALIINDQAANQTNFQVQTNGNTKIGNSATAPYKKLTVNGDAAFANYGNPTDGYNAFEILGNDQIPTRRGISVDNDQNGDFNLWINANQSSSEFNFKVKPLVGPPRNLMVLNAAGLLTLNSFNPAINDAFVINDGNSTQTDKSNFKVKTNGTVYAREVFVQLTPFPDYVFKPDYKLMPIGELEFYVKTNSHLPNVPTAADIKENGANLGEIQKANIEKTEELYLYLFELNKKVEALAKENEELKAQINHK